MTTPKVLDAAGREIVIGSRVERRIGGERRGGISGVVTWAGRQIDVTWITTAQASCRTYGTTRLSLLSRKRCCPDLLLNDDENGESNG